MCGIAGFNDFNKQSSQETLQKMTDVLFRRGPDDSGYLFLENSQSQIGLGHRRLSILDLSSLGHQPMRFEHLSIVFNGEVYNFDDIKITLQQLGYQFNSHSDTEVVLKAYHCWGKKCVEHFRGMWAFALYDHNADELVLCRDRLGVKPLYYYHNNNFFMFASEIKSFHQHGNFIKSLNENALPYYFKYGYIPAPLTIFKHTHKLTPGHWLTIGKNGHIEEIPYWKAETFRNQGLNERKLWLGKTEDTIISELEPILEESFRLRMVSDVPVGMFLSGGIDSSLVTALLQKDSGIPLKTFTIGFHETENNEAIWAKKVAAHLKTDHTELYCTPKDAYELIFSLPELYDEPFGDSSAIPTHLVSKLAKNNVTVSLSADGGDELFGGYTNYAPAIKLSKMLSKLPYEIRKHCTPLLLTNTAESFAVLAHSLLPKSKQVTNFKDKYYKLANTFKSKNALEVFDISKSYWFDNEIKYLLPNMQVPNIYDVTYSEDDLLNLMMMMDMKTYMADDILTKVDRATMGISLEGREPFLDNKIVEYALQMPSEWKIRNGKTKYPLRQILYKYVPKEYIERPKQGFGMPIHKWFRNELKDLYEHYLSEERLSETGLFDAKYVRAKLNDFYDGKPVNASKFWLLLNFEMWREKWM